MSSSTINLHHLNPPCSLLSFLAFITQPHPGLLKRNVAGWKCCALDAASARNSAEILLQRPRQTPRSPPRLWRGATAEGRGVKIPVAPVTSCQRSELSGNHGNISHWWDFFFIFHQQGQSGRSRWNGWHSWNATLRWEGQKSTDRAQQNNKQSWEDFHPFLRVPNEICSSEIPGHISF